MMTTRFDTMAPFLPREEGVMRAAGRFAPDHDLMAMTDGDPEAARLVQEVEEYVYTLHMSMNAARS